MSEKKNYDIVEKLITINRNTKVVKGGRIFSFSALVVVGNKNGKIGFSTGKAREVPIAIKKAIASAKKKMLYFNICKRNFSIKHSVSSSYCATKVIIHPAKKGTGLIAGKVIRAICEAIGINNISAKSIGSRNPINTTIATINSFKKLFSKKYMAQKRDKNIKELFCKNID